MRGDCGGECCRTEWKWKTPAVVANDNAKVAMERCDQLVLWAGGGLAAVGAVSARAMREPVKGLWWAAAPNWDPGVHARRRVRRLCCAGENGAGTDRSWSSWVGAIMEIWSGILLLSMPGVAEGIFCMWRRVAWNY